MAITSKLTAKDNTNTVDWLNVGLIFLSLFLAFKIPFELFLFAYAVLGPLHYLTQINWLNGKQFFVKEYKWIVVYIVFCCFLAVPMIFRLPAFKPYAETGLLKYYLPFVQTYFNDIFLVALLFGGVLVFFSKWQYRLIGLGLSLIIGVTILKLIPFSAVLFGAFLPSIIHVYLFTLLFMIYGSQKSKSVPGILASVIMVLVPFIIMNTSVNPENYHPSAYIGNTFLAGDFQVLNVYIGKFLGVMDEPSKFLLSRNGIRIQVFITFCYTYHYLNWFSKTTVIGWHKNISKKKSIVIGVLWLLSVALYAYDYRTGLAFLFFLSAMHVFMEFPLNITSVKGIFSGFKK
jgi:hypothetical protein